MTANQMKYLLALLRQENRKRSITNVALIYGVNKSTVSRALAVCAEKGLIDQDMELTPYGSQYMEEYKYQFDRIVMWLCNNSVEEETAKKDAFVLLERCSKETLGYMIQGGEFMSAKNAFINKSHNNIVSGEDLFQYIKEGEYQVPFVFYKDKKSDLDKISMANNAFYHPGKMVVKSNKSHLCLKLKIMKQWSFSEKVKLEGKLKNMSYETISYHRDINIDDDVAYLPLCDFNFLYIKDESRIHGSIRLKMSCTVGKIHMPESTAILTIFL